LLFTSLSYCAGGGNICFWERNHFQVAYLHLPRPVDGLEREKSLPNRLAIKCARPLLEVTGVGALDVQQRGTCTIPTFVATVRSSSILPTVLDLSFGWSWSLIERGLFACASSPLSLHPSRQLLNLNSLHQTNKLAGYLKNLLHHARRHVPDRIISKVSTSIDWTSKTGGRFDRPSKRMLDPPDAKSEKPEKSYLSAAVESISPWGGSRSSTPKPSSTGSPGEGSGLKNQHGGDATTQHWHGIRSTDYPDDCKTIPFPSSCRGNACLYFLRDYIGLSSSERK
jgi:hypothetical protein